VMAKEGGMGSSGAFNAALMIGASMLAGSGLSEGDIFSIGTKMENAEFQGLTGGQELLSSLQGGAMLHVWLFGFSQGYSAFTIPLTDPAASAAFGSKAPDGLPALTQLGGHALYVQAGKTFANGKPEVHRTAAAVNIMWTDLLDDGDPESQPVLRRMKELSTLYAKGLLQSDLVEAVKVINEFVDLRVEMGHRWLHLILQASKNVEKVLGVPAWKAIGEQNASLTELQQKFKENNVPQEGLRYAFRVWDAADATFFEFESVRLLYEDLDKKKELHKFTSNDFYVYGPVVQLLAATRAKGDIAVMPLGAGGPGANLIAMTSNSRGVAYLQEVLAEGGITQLDEEEVAAIVQGTGTIRGWMPFTYGATPWNSTVEAHVPAELQGDQQLNAEVQQLVQAIKANRPSPAVWATYDQRSGHITPAA